MRTPLEDVASLNRLVNEPAAFMILTVLSGCRLADFRFLQSCTGMDWETLLSHLATLEEHGLIAVKTTFRRKGADTRIQITPRGRLIFQPHLDRAAAKGRAARGWGWRGWLMRRFDGGHSR